jgi:tetratricopeptide (TPR) repeat protein
MSAAVDLELTLRPAGHGYHAETRCRAPGSEAPIDAGATVQIEVARLRELALDPAAYGLALGEMVLVQAISRALDQARVAAQRANVSLRLRLVVPSELHLLRWETLRDPAHPDGPLLTTGGQILFSRYLSSADWTPVQPRPLGGRRALVLLASPSDLADYGLAPFDVAAERAIIEQSLGEIPTTVLGMGQATLSAFVEALRSGPDILYLMAHGRVDAEGETWLYLEDADGQTAPVRGSEVAARIAEQAVRPQLVILGSCESAGDGHGEALLTLGPLLARAGVGAVLAMQGKITLETLRTFLPACLKALVEDGRIDQAVSHARGLVRDRADFWAPVLFLRLQSGRLWSDPHDPVPPTPQPVQIRTEHGDVAGRDIDKRQGTFIEGSMVILPSAPGPAQALHQLRAPVADFVGREGAVARLVAALRTGRDGRAAAISGVRGMGGIGKTELAYAVANQLQVDYPDAQLVLELRGASDTPLSPAQALQRVIGTFWPAEKLPEELSALQALYRTVLAGLRVLILADDARDSAQVRPLLPPVGCALLVTSRQRFLLDGMLPVDLDQLSEKASVQLLRGICARLDEAQAQQLAVLCGCLPLALRISAGILVTNPARPVARYLTQLTDERQRLRHMRSLDDPERDVAAVLHLSYATLDQPTQSSFRQLGVLAADADLTLIAAVLDQEIGQAETVLEHLLHRSLVEYDETRERWGMHDLVRVFALERLAKVGEEHTLRLRYVRQVIRVIAQAEQRYRVGGTGVLEGLARFDQERTHREAVREWLWAQPSSPENDALVWDEAGATPYIEELRDPVRAVRVPRWNQVMGVARRHGDRLGEGAALGNLGGAYQALGEAHRAIGCFEQCLVIAQEMGDRRGEGAALGNLGNAYRALGEAHRAIGCFEQCLVIAREMGDRRGEGAALGNLGNACADLGEARRAINYFEQDLAIAQEVGDRCGEGAALGNLGGAYQALGEARRAISYFEQCLAITRETGDRGGEGTTLGNLGNAYRALGETRRAMSCFEQRLAIAQEVGDRRGEGIALGNLGLAYTALGEARQAISYHEQHLVIARETSDQRFEGWALGNRGAALVQLEDAESALADSEEALRIARAVGDQQLEGRVLCDVGAAHALLGQHKEADAHYHQSLTLLGQIDHQTDAARTRWAYGQFLVRQGERERGIALLEECVAYEQRIGHAQAEDHAALIEHLCSGGVLPA